jgi:hypothetical protein
MNEAEVIAALRILVSDIAELGKSPITKDSAMTLLESSSAGGGPLVQWFNRETDPRRKKVLRELIRLTVRAGYIHDGAAIAEATEQLSALVDRVDDAETVNQGNDEWVKLQKQEHYVRGRFTLTKHADDPKQTHVKREKKPNNRYDYWIKKSAVDDWIDPSERKNYRA